MSLSNSKKTQKLEFAASLFDVKQRQCEEQAVGLFAVPLKKTVIGVSCLSKVILL